MINKVSGRIILRYTSPLFDLEKSHPSDRIGVLLNDNVIRVNKGSALEDFINEREELRKKIKDLSSKIDTEVQNKDEEINENDTDNTKAQLEGKLEEVDKLITGYEKGFLINSTDEDVKINDDGMSLLA